MRQKENRVGKKVEKKIVYKGVLGKKKTLFIASFFFFGCIEVLFGSAVDAEWTPHADRPFGSSARGAAADVTCPATLQTLL